MATRKSKAATKRASPSKSTAAKKTTTRASARSRPAKKASVAASKKASPASASKVASSEKVALAPASAVSEHAGDDVLAQIVTLLDGDSEEHRRSAAVVLGALSIPDESTLEALKKASRRTDDPVLRARSAEAIGALAPKSIVEDLMPLLKDSDANVRETTRRVLASGRGVTAKDIAKMLHGEGRPAARGGAIAVLGAMGTEEAQERIIDQLDDDSSRILEAVQDALVPIYDGLEGEEAASAARVLVARLDALDLTLAARGRVLIELWSALGHEEGAEGLCAVAVTPTDESCPNPRPRGSADRGARPSTGHHGLFIAAVLARSVRDPGRTSQPDVRRARGDRPADEPRAAGSGPAQERGDARPTVGDPCARRPRFRADRACGPPRLAETGGTRRTVRSLWRLWLVHRPARTALARQLIKMVEEERARAVATAPQGALEFPCRRAWSKRSVRLRSKLPKASET